MAQCGLAALMGKWSRQQSHPDTFLLSGKRLSGLSMLMHSLRAGTGYAVIAAAGLVLIFLLRQLPKLFGGMGSGRQRADGVNDRSLGGKAVSPLRLHVQATRQ